ncbi:MAG: hypothetical protein HWN80_20400, partial [Candidatus Lokiarchaeota archaeon]|nr:hypothetical protein [Candidatus Lokiarchaeota archaeon]
HFDKNTGTGTYAIHHKDSQRSWSIYIKDLMITTNRYHGVYGSLHITTQDTDILLEGMGLLIELGIDRYKKGSANWEITEKDIESVFTRLGGGSMYKISDGRTVLEWWKDGSLYILPPPKRVNTLSMSFSVISQLA